MLIRQLHPNSLLSIPLLVTFLLVLLLALIGTADSVAADREAVDRTGAPSRSHPSEMPPEPLITYGTVKLNGVSVPSGTLIGGWCNGTQVAEEPATVDEFEGQVQSIYLLAVSSLDCVPGSTATFTIGGIPAYESTVWTSDPTRLDLTSTFGVTVTKQVSSDGDTWHDADSTASALTVDVGTDVMYRIGVTNTSVVTVGLTLTDTVDGTTTRALSAACDVPPPATLAPAGEEGSSYTCLMDGTVEAGAHENVVSATVSFQAWSHTAADPAHAFGIERGVEVEKLVWDGARWYDADTAATYPTIALGTDLAWRIAITNTSNVTVDLTVADALDGAPLDLATACTVAPPEILAPAGSPEAAYVCNIVDSATMGSHRNEVTATVAFGGFDVTEVDVAGYVGAEPEVGVEVRKRVFDGSAWHDADSASTVPEIVVETDLTWRIMVTNTSNVSVDLAVTDTLDGEPLELASVCTVAPPATLGPAGMAGASYVCEIGDSATLGDHRNVVTATVSVGDVGVSAVDAAGYVGIEAGWEIYLPLVLRSAP